MPVPVPVLVRVLVVYKRSNFACLQIGGDNGPASNSAEVRARLQLLCTSALWGTYPTTLKLLYAADGATLTPSTVTALRFAIMATTSYLFLTAQRADSDGSDDSNAAANDGTALTTGFVLAAAELGMWGCGGTQLNSLGLQELSAVRATTLLATVNILTPSLQAIVWRAEDRNISPRTWLACGLALAFTAFGASSSDSTSAATTLPSGADSYVLAAAFCYAMAKVRLSSLIARYPAQRLAAGRLQSQCLISFAILGGAALLSGSSGDATAAATLTTLIDWASFVTPTQLALLFVSALAPGVAATMLQAAGQRVVPAAQAQPIYASMPLFAAGWAALVLHEPISATQAVGGLGACGAALLASTGQSADTKGDTEAAPTVVVADVAKAEALTGVVTPTAIGRQPQPARTRSSDAKMSARPPDAPGAPPDWYASLASFPDSLAHHAAAHAGCGAVLPEVADDDTGCELLDAPCLASTTELMRRYPGTDVRLAAFAGGCFWGLELAYQRTPGVLSTCVGYTQGQLVYPSYSDVCTGETGHTEAVLIMYDAAKVSYGFLAELLFDRIGDPTQLNRVGSDRGTQYRTGLYFHSREQEAAARTAFEREDKSWRSSGRPVVTEVHQATVFWPAEERHQRFLQKGNGRSGRPQSAAKGVTEDISCYG